MKLLFLLAFILLGTAAAQDDAYYWGEEGEEASPGPDEEYWGEEGVGDETAEADEEYWGGEEAEADEEYWGGEEAEECEDPEEEDFYCTDGDSIPADYVCDDYCDCMGCEDEVPCENGLGVTRIDLAGLSMALNLKHEGGQYGIMTTNLIGGIFYCILHPGDCLDF